ncbi:MAG: hypothetical protein JWM27_3568 [Gemmatimonadetes bacterium]|nr:hypothetical protein [Gemmatimonadota bacterium]
MGKLMAFIGMSIGGWIGWALGEKAGMMTASTLSAVGSGVGLYVGAKIARDYF